jgi:hypothetical protein
MRMRRIGGLLLTAAATTGVLTAVAPTASAYVPCDEGESYRVTSHNHEFIQVDSVQLVNTRSGTATLSAQVGESHTSSRTFSGSITTSVEGGFWVFAKASASVTAGVSIQTSTTMTKTYTATVSVPGHSTRTVKFGFRRYNQYIQQYHLYNTGPTSCGVHVDHAGWVRAPYQKAFIVS